MFFGCWAMGTGSFVTAIPIDATLSESYEIVSHDMNGMVRQTS